jgi:DNA helicase-2/ATP-dependent DNA helicase PcrA
MPTTPDEIRAAVLEAEGHVLVRGGAGSGKTTLALRKAVKRIDENLLPGQHVLFLSFSRAAVARIAQASNTLVPPPKRPLLAVQTFHSFCWELVKAHGYLLGAPKVLRVLSPHDEKALSDGVEREDAGWAQWEEKRLRIFRDEGKVVFDLFAPKAAELLRRSSLIRELVADRFPLIIVDEAQDTWPDAWECIKTLAPFVQVICLADLDQQIFDHLPGIGPERVAEIEATLEPLCVDLGSENNRSAGTEIAAFGNDVLIGKVRGAAYKGVMKMSYDPRAEFERNIRKAVGIMFGKLKEATTDSNLSCAIMATYGSGVAKITQALSAGDKPIPHKVLFDEAVVLLSARFAAFLLEPKSAASNAADVIIAIELLAQIPRASGSKTGVEKSKKYLIWADQLRRGKRPRASLIDSVERLISEAARMELTGRPGADWLTVKDILKSCSDNSIAAIARSLDYLVAFNRGKRISSNLSLMWAERGSYLRARDALDAALIEEQILAGIEDLSGIHVMTIHRSKGKQFDGVIILREGHRSATGWTSSFVWRDDPSPHKRSRRVLRVGITRAMKQVLVMDPFFPPCPILSPHRL